MSKYTDKLQEWVDSVKMCEAAGIEPCYKYNECLHYQIPMLIALKSLPTNYRFPIAVVEGKLVFVGDELYDRTGVKFTAANTNQHALEGTSPEFSGGVLEDIQYCSWNPPKPKTIMVETLIDDAKYFASGSHSSVTLAEYDRMVERRNEACRKALEELK